jgi:cbb3-type cytochrome oxidase subunit 3
MCKKWIFMVLLFVANFTYAQTTEDKTQHSGSHYIILAIIAIIVIVYILYRRQSR